MGLPSRGVLIRLCIYIPLIGFLGWRAMNSRCGADEPTVEAEPSLDDELAPYRKTITFPDGTQQEIVELTPAQAEAVLGQRIPRDPPPKTTAEVQPIDPGPDSTADHADSGTTGAAAHDSSASSD